MSENSLDDLVTIFSIDRKQELKRHCRTAIITQTDFANLIMTCMIGGAPLAHQRHHREYIPNHLQLSENDLGTLTATGQFKARAQKTMRKVSAIFDERRLLTGHIFLSPDQSRWHLFYFDQRDFSERNNHWDGGAHIHLINWLWSGRTAQSTWKEFCDGNPKMKGALHIRFVQGLQ
jgi:hypothetical protein